jgi:hypothetical protein
MKSNKQRRDEIRSRRLERAERLAKQIAKQNPDTVIAPGIVLADRDALARHNNTYAELPRYYLDRPFICHDCGASCVWTAKQQKWWFEQMHGSIWSQPLRCLPCRRARRARRAAAGEGADLLRQQSDRLRALGAGRPNAEARAEVDAALQSKWWSLRLIAIETLGRWGGPKQIAQLEALAAAANAEDKPPVRDDDVIAVEPPGAYKDRNWAREAALAARKALWRRGQSGAGQ